MNAGGEASRVRPPHHAAGDGLIQKDPLDRARALALRLGVLGLIGTR